ncbi:hypothetical protein GGR56DRAFT_386601 [Xylariaceae sp. FL0804]|nr:hypothetical protein GGR56DRAFT_386601 [Xylariaceae sp. FL0804]
MLAVFESSVEDHQRGYPRLAAFVSSSRDFVMFRCFATLHARIVLHKQDELAELEERLVELDRRETTAYFLTSRRSDGNAERGQLLREIEQKLAEYNDLIESYYRHVERPRPRDVTYDSVFNWVHGNKPLAEAESSFLDNRTDLRCPELPHDYGGLDAALENWSAMVHFGGYSWGKFITLPVRRNSPVRWRHWK